MTQKAQDNVTRLPRKSRRLSISTCLLITALAFSVFQYAHKGEVHWMTDSFRFVDAKVGQAIGGRGLGGLTPMVVANWHRATHFFAKLSQDSSESAGGLTREIVQSSFSSSRDGISGTVIGVTDGDTIKVLDAGRVMYKVRLQGIDAPEKGQPFGSVSAERLASLVSGKDVFVESTKRDQYGRVLGKVWVQPADCLKCEKTLDVNHAQLLYGMAWWYRYHAEDQSPEDQGRYESAEDEAKARKLGLWSEPRPINPYDWRQGRR